MRVNRVYNPQARKQQSSQKPSTQSKEPWQIDYAVYEVLKRFPGQEGTKLIENILKIRGIYKTLYDVQVSMDGQAKCTLFVSKGATDTRDQYITIYANESDFLRRQAAHASYTSSPLNGLVQPTKFLSDSLATVCDRMVCLDDLKTCLRESVRIQNVLGPWLKKVFDVLSQGEFIYQGLSLKDILYNFADAQIYFSSAHKIKREQNSLKKPRSAYGLDPLTNQWTGLIGCLFQTPLGADTTDAFTYQILQKRANQLHSAYKPTNQQLIPNLLIALSLYHRPLADFSNSFPYQTHSYIQTTQPHKLVTDIEIDSICKRLADYFGQLAKPEDLFFQNLFRNCSYHSLYNPSPAIVQLDYSAQQKYAKHFVAFHTAIAYIMKKQDLPTPENIPGEILIATLDNIWTFIAQPAKPVTSTLKPFAFVLKSPEIAIQEDDTFYPVGRTEHLQNKHYSTRSSSIIGSLIQSLLLVVILIISVAAWDKKNNNEERTREAETSQEIPEDQQMN